MSESTVMESAVTSSVDAGRGSMTLNLSPLERRDELSPEEFLENYFRPRRPVVFRSFSNAWPAREKWTLDYFRETYGDISVPVYEEAFADSGASYGSTDDRMPFRDYLDLIDHEPTKKRLFLFNIFKYAPELCHDFDYPVFARKWATRHPFMFFGGETSHVDGHFDVDLSHVFLTQFHGTKRVVLYGPQWSSHLYRHKFTVSHNVDLGNPDFERYPRLLDAEGFECVIEHGDTVYMPSGWWHYVYYLTGGFSLALRSPITGPVGRSRMLYRVLALAVGDHGMTKLLGQKRWYARKEAMAQRKAARL
ncbi:MAG: cupin-like domain-containing protein [Phycisphaerales bacterium]|nr:cupin-like domain-containing protein [Phycisphaerales bacterium]